MKKVAISVDSSCDMPPALLEKYTISVLPFYINYGDETYIDGLTIDRDTLYKRASATGILPQTAAPAPAVFTDHFEKLLESAESVVHFSIGEKLSSAYQNALLAAAEFSAVHVVDTQNLSSAESLIILHAVDLAAQGANAAAIATDATDYAKRCDASFVLDTLAYMYKGGRCSGITALGANLLGIKPCLEMRDGTLVVSKKYRGKLQIVIEKYVTERLANLQAEPERIFITDSGVDIAIRDAAVAAVEKSGMFNEILLSDAGCIISSHCGPGTLGILFVRKPDKV